VTIPDTLDGAALTQAQHSRLGRLVTCARLCDGRLPSRAILDYACDCLRQTMVRDGEAFRDIGRIRSGGRSFAIR
jgi:hypothetical protein